MNSRTYYDILGVSRDATPEEITAAKNALAKVYHPDANMHKDIDTTAFMQEILEAYRTLSNPDKRQAYDEDTFGGAVHRVFRTFTLGKDDEETESDDSISFVTYWNAAYRLNEMVTEGIHLMKNETQNQSLSQRILRKVTKEPREEAVRSRRIRRLSRQAFRCVALLRTSGIPSRYWHPETMNWVLIRWGQRQNIDYLTLFPRYEAYLEEAISSSEKKKIKSRTRQYQQNLKKLLTYDSES